MSTLGRILLGLPGWLVFGMTAVWLGPFCIHDLAQYPLQAHWHSHLLYGVIFGAALLVLLALNLLREVQNFWGSYGVWARVGSVCGAYAAAMVLSLVVIMELEKRGILQYYGGDAGGGAALLVMPSVGFYCVAGVIVGLVAHYAGYGQRAAGRKRVVVVRRW